MSQNDATAALLAGRLTPHEWVAIVSPERHERPKAHDHAHDEDEDEDVAELDCNCCASSGDRDYVSACAICDEDTCENCLVWAGDEAICDGCREAGHVLSCPSCDDWVRADKMGGCDDCSVVLCPECEPEHQHEAIA